jgi:cation transport ATPase
MSFSFPALFLILIILLPNLLFILYPPANKPESMPEENKRITMLERGGQILFFAVFLFSPAATSVNRNPILLIWMIVCTTIYYAFWVRYMVKEQAFSALFDTVLGIPIPMALFPILAFTFGVLWLQAWLALIPLLLFAIGHFINSRNSNQHLHS